MGSISGTIFPPLTNSITPRIYIISLVVGEEWRKQGIGRHLVDSLLHKLLATSHQQLQQKKVWISLHCAEEDIGVRRFYERLGLKERNRVQGYYKKGSAIEMGGLILC
jgi:ribosomal protein S18 acetylase RimI-like enzyme